jgi:catechol 2,3-dioxygenase-like lactoylglutathione lyase family enzyme
MNASPISATPASTAIAAPAGPVRILAFDHVGIRVSDHETALRFYERLGFRETLRFPDHQANEMLSADGVRINLIFNAARRPDARNVLLDEAIKLPGITHPAFIVDDLEALMRWLAAEGIVITEGPHRIGPRRVALFIRDPDGNVLEFNQLIQENPIS